MSVVGLNDLLPQGFKIKRIQTGSELLLAYELGKYAKKMMGVDLVLSNVSISKDLQSGEHFSFVVTNGLDVGFFPQRDTLADYSANARYFFTQTVEGAVFQSVSEDEVVYSFEHDVQANRILHGENRSAAYVSLVAYLMIKSKLEGTKMPKLVIDHEKYNQQELEYVDLFILRSYGNTLLKDLVDIRYSTAWGFQPDWEAFVVHNRQKGLMNREYTSTEKFRHLKKNFEVGDVVLLYTRNKGARGKTINTLESCFPAVIRYYDQNSIKFTYYPEIRTKMTQRMLLMELENDFIEEGKESIFTYNDFERFTVQNKEAFLTRVGVDTCTFTETTFFIKPVDTDGTHQYLETPQGRDYVWLPTLDTIYAVFEDREIEYNKEKFLEEHFYSKGREPIYEQYRQKLA